MDIFFEKEELARSYVRSLGSTVTAFLRFLLLEFDSTEEQKFKITTMMEQLSKMISMMEKRYGTA